MSKRNVNIIYEMIKATIPTEMIEAARLLGDESKSGDKVDTSPYHPPLT
ncbi:hypothetical protein NTE28_003582 [Vibrio harveyi]|nr:hypothetical protein [Vibrio harveyi]